MRLRFKILLLNLAKTTFLSSSNRVEPKPERGMEPTLLWSHQSIPGSDETWLPEWSGNLGVVQRWRSSVASGVLGQASLSAYGVKPVG